MFPSKAVKVGACTTDMETGTYYFYLGDNVGETRLRWFGHVQMTDSDIRQRMLNMELPGRN